jgi:membrane protease YdiL (CAAX protease family)
MRISGALFSIAHLGSGGLVPAFILGILLAWLYWKTGSLWPCILAWIGRLSFTPMKTAMSQ